MSAILRKLRPPYTLPVRVIYGFSSASPTNLGLTLDIPSGAPLVAPGDGVVDLITHHGGLWRSSTGTAVRALAVRIDHGNGIKTYVHGLVSVTCGYGPITRGQQLGVAQGPDAFFAVEQGGRLIDPAFVNASFGIQDGFLNFGKAQKLRQAPDLITTVFSTVTSLLASGRRYFFPATARAVLINLDFNGSADKSGPAVVGFSGDVWQDVAALDFEGTPDSYGACYYVTVFPAAQGFFVNDHLGKPTKIFFERSVLTADSGSSAFFDPMLSTWVGGYDGVTPLVNTFTLRNLPGGVYDLYVYTNGGSTSDDTTVYVATDGGVPTNKTASPIGTGDWVENRNYLRFASLSVVNRGEVSVSVSGYLAGLQLIRV